MTPFSIVCLSSQDWDVALPTNRQQIMRIAAARRHHVLFVETGHFVGRHLVRLRQNGRRSLLRRLAADEAVGANLRVRKALNLAPFTHRSRTASRFNAHVTAALLRRRLRTLEGPVVFWLYDPVAAQVARSFAGAWVAYDCVDDYPAQASGTERHRALVAAADAAAARDADIVFATTPTLYDRQRARNENTHLVPNVGDYSHFVSAADRATASPDVANLRGPVVGFAGNFSKQKVDFELIARAAAARPEWTFLLVGPTHADTQAQLDRVVELPNVRWTGPKPYRELPRYVAAFDVGVIPYLTNEYTRSCFPLKLYEYLAAGLPVVATGLPALRGVDPDVLSADGPELFLAAVETALARRSDAERARRMGVAAANTWETRADRLLGLVANAIDARNGRPSR